MKRILKALSLGAMLVSCADTTGTMGVYPEAEQIVNSHRVVSVQTRSIALGAVRTASDINYLGDIVDPETDTRIHSDFAAQFYAFEDFKFPPMSKLFTPDEWRQDANVRCDSVQVRLYFEKYYGDGNNPLKLEVYPLSMNNILSEDSVYSSDIDLTKFVDQDVAPIATKVFSPTDYGISDARRNSTTYTKNVSITLPDSIGTDIMQAYYKHPENFKDAYSFVHNVCPGFYFKLRGGSGSMLAVSVGVLDVYFHRHDEAKPDSVIAEFVRFAATPEVIQSTRFTHDNISELLSDETCTYLKSPAGIGTEITFPINEIMEGHEVDSISKAPLVLNCFNKEGDEQLLGTPDNVLLVRKQDMQSFFNDRKVSNNITSFTTQYQSAYNAYSFANLGRLLSFIYMEKQLGMLQADMSEAEWEAAHPDWNKYVLIPIKRTTTTASGSTTLQLETSVTHDMDLNSVRLVGGANSPIQMQIVYSRYK